MRHSERTAQVLFVAVLTAAAGAAVALPGPESASAGPGAVRQDASPGRAVFQGKGNCFTCHGQDGRGSPLGPDLTDDEWVNSEGRPSPDQVETLLRMGVPHPVQHPAPMPPMGGGRLTDEEVRQLVEYVLSLSGPPRRVDTRIMAGSSGVLVARSPLHRPL